MTQHWFYIQDGKRIGPVADVVLRRLAATGELLPTDLVFHEGMSQWVKAFQVNGLFALGGGPGQPRFDLGGRSQRGPTPLDRFSRQARWLGVIVTAVSVLVGAGGDLLRPLAPINLILCVLAAAATLVFLVLSIARSSDARVFRLALACLASLCATITFGCWAGLGALTRHQDKGLLAGTLKPLEDLQTWLIPPGESDPTDKERPRPVEDTAADFRVAGRVLSLGGIVRVLPLDKNETVRARDNFELPVGPFLLLDVDMQENKKVTDADLESFQGLAHLNALNLSQQPITDAGLAHLKDLKSLSTLNLSGTRITDAGLAHLQGLIKLTVLSLGRTKVGDAGLAHLHGLQELAMLWAGGEVTDEGLRPLAELPKLAELRLGSTKVTDAGLVHLQRCAGLRRLGLGGLPITDAGLAHLTNLSLGYLFLGGTKVTPGGRKRYEEAHPSCVIEM